MKHFQKENGLIGLYVTIIVLLLMVGIIASIGFGVLTQQRIIRNITESAQAYAAAESGIEDGLLRLHNSLMLPGSYPYSLQVGSAEAQVTISPVFSGSRTITSSGDSLGRLRSIEVVYEITTTTAEFFYGAHVGEGGLKMGQNSGVFGNVFSNGDVALANNAGIGKIFPPSTVASVEIAGAGHRLYHTSGGSWPFVNGDATVDICDDVRIVGTLKANSGSGECGVPDVSPITPPDPIPLPISNADIQVWKDAAQDGGITNGNVIVAGVSTTLGPQKIVGNLTIENNAQLTLKGTLWVTGNITIKNNTYVHLDSGYGATSGIIVTDGVVTFNNNHTSEGSGSAGSYLMYLSTASLNPSIDLGSQVYVDVMYASNGWILLNNNSTAREITGYGIELANNVGLNYEIGLQNTAFASGTGGGWEVASWKEIE